MANAAVAFFSSLLLQAMCASIGVRCPDFAQSCAVVSMVVTVATSTTLAERSGGEGEGSKQRNPSLSLIEKSASNSALHTPRRQTEFQPQNSGASKGTLLPTPSPRSSLPRHAAHTKLKRIETAVQGMQPAQDCHCCALSMYYRRVRARCCHETIWHHQQPTERLACCCQCHAGKCAPVTSHQHGS